MASHIIIKNGKTRIVQCTKRFYKPNRRALREWNKSWEKKEER